MPRLQLVEQLAFTLILLTLAFGASGCNKVEEPPESVTPATPNAPVSPALFEASPVKLLPESEVTDWPWWRGAQLNNKSVDQDVPLTWSESEEKSENIVWKSPVPGRGLSTPTIYDDQIYLTTADEEKKTIHLLCYGREEGEPRWNKVLHEDGFQVTHKKNSQASQTVAFDGERAFVPHLVERDGQTGIWVSAVDMSGEIVWQVNAGAFTSLHGYGSSPVLYGSLVIIAADNGETGFIAALERSTGKTRWRVERAKEHSFATPTIAHVAGRDQLLLHGTRIVASYDPATGQELWRCDGASKAAANTMVADNTRVYASGGYPEKVLLAIRADGSGDVSETHIEWKKSKGICYVPSMLLHEGLLYAINDDGIGHCYVAETGEAIWKKRVPGNFSASPTLVGDRLYIPNEAGKMYVLKTGREFEILAENDLEDGGFATPVIVGGRIYLRTDHNLYCIGKVSGEKEAAAPVSATGKEPATTEQPAESP